jgi:hypothetical protein
MKRWMRMISRESSLQDQLKESVGRSVQLASRDKVAERWFIYIASCPLDIRYMLTLADLDSFDVADLKVVCSDAISVKAYHTRSTDLKDSMSPIPLVVFEDGLMVSIPPYNPSWPG